MNCGLGVVAVTCGAGALNTVPETAPALIARALRNCREYSQPVLIDGIRALRARAG